LLAFALECCSGWSSVGRSDQAASRIAAGANLTCLYYHYVTHQPIPKSTQRILLINLGGGIAQGDSPGEAWRSGHFVQNSWFRFLGCLGPASGRQRGRSA
jgi:hypothetical protein